MLGVLVKRLCPLLGPSNLYQQQRHRLRPKARPPALKLLDPIRKQHPS